MAGDAIGIFGRANGIPLDKTRYFTTFTLIAMLAGYIIGIFSIPKYLPSRPRCGSRLYRHLILRLLSI